MAVTRLIMLAALGAGASAQLHTGDIVLSTASGSIETGAGAPSQGAFVPGEVFPATLPTSPPHFNSNPGFDCESGTFPPSSAVGFDLLSTLQRFEPSDGSYAHASQARLRVSFSTLATISSTDEQSPEVQGFSILADSSGVWHRHLTWWVQDASGSAGVPVSSGAYAMVMRLWSGAGTIGDSEPFVMLFGIGASASLMEDAAEAASSLLPDDPIPGDANGDGVVDFSDLNAVLSQFGQMAPDLLGDVDGDGDVDFSDLNVVLVNFGAGSE